MVAARPPPYALKHTLGRGRVGRRVELWVPSAPSRRGDVAARRKMANRSGDAQLGILPSGCSRRPIDPAADTYVAVVAAVPGAGRGPRPESPASRRAYPGAGGSKSTAPRVSRAASWD